ncbi:hypothetical protein QYE76_040368 [Lolium multiflorum]|uniref:Uncharacterized protein n=1 Tax=Lolium multiflorum TaxID=4521 RepID=A0AAD8TB19_LOLMU|nr:hypothetical protein QYE76_040368 [Lolium multiflorum]
MAMADTATAPLLTNHGDKLAKAPSIDDTIETYMGTTGAGQLLKAILLAFAWAFDSQQVFISVFTDAEPLWHCTGTDASCSPATASPCALPASAWAWDRPAVTSVVSEWSLKCAGPALVSLPASSFFVGCLAGGFLLTTLADSLLGRRKMLLTSIVTMSVAGVLTAFSPNVWAYTALRFVSGFARSMVGTCTMVLSTELVGKKWRDTVCGRILLLHPRESPRWLLVRGRKQDAIEALQQIASLNGNSITSSFSMLHACTMQEDVAGASDGVFATLRSMWERPWALRRLAAIMTTSFGVGTVYYGMPLNVGNLGSNLYLSVMARRMAAELVSFSATCTAFNVIMMYAIELFPTSVRNSAVGLVRQALVLGGGGAVLVALGRDSSFLSFGVFGLLIGCFGMFAACLPETRGKAMSDTMDEEEQKEAAVANCTVDYMDCTSADLV